MNLKASGTLAASTKIQYIRMPLRVEVLRQLDRLSVEVVSTTIAHLNCIV